MADILKFTEDHLWLRVEGNRAQLGISEYGQAELGEVIAVELPDVGARRCRRNGACRSTARPTRRGG